MGGPAADLASLSNAVAAAGHLALALVLLWKGYLRAGAAQRAFLAAVALTAAWAGLAFWEPHTRRELAPAIAVLDVARYAGWFAFVLLLLRADRPGSVPRALVAAAAAMAALALAALAVSDSASRLFFLTQLGLAVTGGLLLEQLYRNLVEDSRWNVKPVGLGLGIVFVFDVYVFSEAFLFGAPDSDALTVRGAVHALALPLLVLAARRRAAFAGRLRLSRSVAFYSTTLLLAGGYLLFVSAVGWYVRRTGGDWGRALQIGVLVAAVAAAVVLAFSGSLRAWVRVFVGKHFFRLRYDYREEWLRLTALLSSSSAGPQDTGVLVIRGLADMVESNGGRLWTKGSDGDFRPSARWNQPEAAESGLREPAGSPFARFLQTQGWILDMAEFRAANSRARSEAGELALPPWLLADAEVWLVVPLLSGDELQGFVTLAPARVSFQTNWEVRDLLKTAGRQAAGLLAQVRATEALVEARKFDAFNKMSAFVVHDLKNIVTQLSLMMKNAQRLHNNPEFRQDMLLTVESSLEKMRRLMLQLREGATPPGGALGVELAPIARRLAAMAEGRGRSLEVECPEGLATRGHDERIERVLGHLVHNALDATQPGQRVWLKARRVSGELRVEVGDEGLGMSEEFVQNKLFRPFNSTKSAGMGIGSYEAMQYVRELGGAIAVASTPGMGTVVTVTLPVFETPAEAAWPTASA